MRSIFLISEYISPDGSPAESSRASISSTVSSSWCALIGFATGLEQKLPDQSPLNSCSAAYFFGVLLHSEVIESLSHPHKIVWGVYQWLCKMTRDNIDAELLPSKHGSCQPLCAQ